MCATPFDGNQQRKVALLIGNNEYEGSPLDNCVNDANDLSEALKSIGFIVITKTNLTCEEMETIIGQFVESIQMDDIVVFFYSGHGVQCEDQNYLIPCDHNRILGVNDLKYRSTHAQRILELMSDQNPTVVIYLLDCCRTYSLPRSPKSKTMESSRGMANMSPKTGTVIAFACAPGTIASDQAPNERNGMFTYHLLQHITRPEEDIALLLRDVTKGVHHDTNGRQKPYTTAALMERDIFLASSSCQITHLNAELSDSLQSMNILVSSSECIFDWII